MNTFVTITAMAAIFAAHVAVMVELRPRSETAPKEKQKANSGEAP